jgi:hypothetical protein
MFKRQRRLDRLDLGRPVHAETIAMPPSPTPAGSGKRVVHCGTARRGNSVRLRSIRPSLVDPRFHGDVWIVDGEDGLTSLYLQNLCLAQLQLLSFDVASLNGAVQHMRCCRR